MQKSLRKIKRSIKKSLNTFSKNWIRRRKNFKGNILMCKDSQASYLGYFSAVQGNICFPGCSELGILWLILLSSHWCCLHYYKIFTVMCFLFLKLFWWCLDWEQHEWLETWWELWTTEGREGHASFCKVVIKTAWPFFHYLKDIFLICFCTFMENFFKGGLVHILEHLLTMEKLFNACLMLCRQKPDYLTIFVTSVDFNSCTWLQIHWECTLGIQTGRFRLSSLLLCVSYDCSKGPICYFDLHFWDTVQPFFDKK